MIKKCDITGKEFEVTEKDLEFYKEMEVPIPNICPEERMRQRLAFRNERFLYHRKCDLSGKQIISSASIDKPYPIYDSDSWWSDNWNPLDFGRDFDFGRTFFEQFEELRNSVPRLHLQHQKPMQNSDFCNCASKNKNCYLVFSTNNCEDCYYGSWINDCRNCIDNKNIFNCELCYECIDCKDCYNLKFSQECLNCSDSYFLRNCIGVKNSIFCTNLRNQEFCILNKQHSAAEFKDYLKQINLGSYKRVKEARRIFSEFSKEIVVKEYFGSQNENVSGNMINKSKNTLHSFECYDCEDVSYSMCVESNVKNCQDYSHWGVNAEKIYMSQACGYNINNLRFCNLCWSNCSDLTYCDHCTSSQECFGCVGLKRHSYCILNKQYSKEEYFELKAQIIRHMSESEIEWGKFYPIKLSPFAYNETMAQEEFPLTEEEALARNYHWKEEETNSQHQGQTTIIVDQIQETDKSICQQILTCEKSDKLYRIIPQEFQFLKEQKIALPRECPDQRHLERIKKRTPKKLFKKKCKKCSKDIQTSYHEDRLERIYCEDCYLAEF